MTQLDLEHHEFVSCKGMTLGYWQSKGIGHRPVLVFMHGNGFAVHTYGQLLRHLTARFDLFLIEIQGHGRTQVQGRFKGWNEWAEAISELVTVKRPSWPHCIGLGHSFGGVLATLSASAHSQLFEQLILLDPIYLPRRTVNFTRMTTALGLGNYHPMIAMTKRRRTVFSDRAAVIANLRGKGVFNNWTDEALVDYAEANFKTIDGGVELITPTRIEAAIFGSYARGLRSAIKRLLVPTDVLYGSKTYPFQQRAILDVAKLNANMKVVMVEGGHCFMQERPGEIAAQIFSLYDKNQGSDGPRG